MAKNKDENGEVKSSKDIMMASFKTNKTDHYNFEDTIYYKVPSSSMIMNMELGGGITPGCLRLTGGPAGGKSSCALDFLRNFLKAFTDKDIRKGIYYKCEGRLPEEMKIRSGVKFVSNPEEWENGTCLVVDSNIFEFIFDNIRELLMNNEEKCKFFFIIDSVDMMVKRADLQKTFDDAQSVAGGALLTSVFLKKVSVALAKRGHIATFISQVRETVNINPYAKTPPKQGGASGGHALEHAQDVVLEFLPRYSDDIIRENPADKNSKPVGHYAKCKIIKSNNESYLREVRYPICYRRVGGTSVWREKEVLDMLMTFSLIQRAGAWYKVNELLIKELAEKNISIDEKFQGIDSVDTWLQANPAAVDYLADKLVKLCQ